MNYGKFISDFYLINVKKNWDWHHVVLKTQICI